ncbi:MAG: hypothetical protein IJ704_03060 [Bacilli bacterium]|nr:hypothetical protein [Bacilli bacterium]
MGNLNTHISYLDAASKEAKEYYIQRLGDLVSAAKEKGKVDSFYLIREDDFFPYEYMWMPTCEKTQIESTCTELSSELRDEIVHEKLNDHPLGFYIPVPQEEYNKKLRELPIELGYLQAPAHFRSTKHFTVNTPLGYTHRYNNVESNRNFIILDSIQNFLDSPYHYSLAYHDAYLDVTHEFFPISEQAIVLMSEENYKSCLNDKDLQTALSKRNLIVFKGEESLAINMVLAGLGALPSRPGNPYMEYDEETQQILENSIQELAFHHHILYDQSHGNLNFKGGHFSDLYDGYHKGMLHFEEEVLDFLKQKYTSYPNFFQYHTFREFIKSGAYHSLITKVGWKSIVQTFEEYNKLALYRFKNERQAYVQERQSITPEQHEVFVKTLEFIKEYYASSEYFDFKTQSYLQSLMIPFFHSYDIESQLDASYALLSFQEDQKRGSLSSSVGEPKTSDK